MVGRPISESFGSGEYWHAAGWQHGTPQAHAEALERLFLRQRDLPAKQWEIPQRVLKAIALELAKGLADRGEPWPGALLSVLAMAMDLPDDFLADPAAFFTGEEVDLDRRRQRDLAMLLDAQHLRRCGSEMPLQALERELQLRLASGVKGPVRATLRDWRRAPDYRLYVDTVGRVAES